MRNYILIFLVFIMPVVSQSQDSVRLINQKSVGILIEYGSPYYYLPEGPRYYVVLTGATFAFPLFKARKFFNLSLGFFPHYGFVWVDSNNENFEFGVNIRLGANFALSPDDVLSLKIASGPHYFTAETEKQAQGFIFSDYFLLTYDRRFFIGNTSMGLNFEFGYRHISNAGLQEPNRSISNFIFGFGVNYVW